MKPFFKLKHLDILIDDNNKKDVAKLMVEVLGYKNSIFFKAKHFVKNFIIIRDMMLDISKTDYSKIEVNKNSPIKKQDSINFICYSAMLELQHLVNSTETSDMSKHIAKVIAISTFEKNRLSDYDSSSVYFKNHFDNILNQPILDMIGLYNFILEDIKITSKHWEDLFFSVEVTDKDYEAAGGAAMSQFNVITTIKNTCADFNCEEKQAWLKSYYLVQNNSYSKAYASFIQDTIRISKEAEIKARNPGPN